MQEGKRLRREKITREKELAAYIFFLLKLKIKKRNSKKKKNIKNLRVRDNHYDLAKAIARSQ